MAACVLALLLTAVLCLGGRQPGEPVTPDPNRDDLTLNGVLPLEKISTDQTTVDKKSTNPKVVKPSYLVRPSQGYGDTKLSHVLKLSKASTGRQHGGMSVKPRFSMARKLQEPTALYRKNYPVNNGRQASIKASEDGQEMPVNPVQGASAPTDVKRQHYSHGGPEIKAENKDATISVSSFLQRLSCSPCHCTLVHGEGVVADCTAKGLTGVPVTLPPNLVKLLMTQNHLHSLPDGAFSDFPNLALLDLSSNLVTNISTRAFNGLLNLQVLYLHGNKLRYTLEVFTAEVLAPLKSLRHLTLHNNTDDMAEDLDYPHLALSRLPLLQELSLDGLTNRTFGDGFAKMKKLTTLTISGLQGFCRIETVSNLTLQVFSSLKNISITKCYLKEIKSEAFLSLQQVDTLDLSKNTNLGFDNVRNALYGLQNSTIRVLNINEIYSYFTPCVTLTTQHTQYLKYTKIEDIRLEQNSIQWIDKGALASLGHNVKRLYASGNIFKYGPYWADILEMKRLELLDVGVYNEVPVYPTPNHGIFQARLQSQERNEISSCVLIGNQFHCRDETESGSVPIQEKGDSPRFTFNLPPNLKELSFRGMMMRYNVYPLEFTPNNSLQTFDASLNMFEAWIGPISNLHNLKLFNLSQTYASHISPLMFTDLKTLEILDISHNLLSNDLAKNGSSAIFDPLTSLQFLNISFNGLYHLPKPLLQNLHSLVTLNAADNKIRADDFLVDLSNMYRLSYIDLSSNLLETLTLQTRRMLDKMTAASNASLTLDLRNNPLACTCGNLDFLRWLHKAHVQLVQAEEQQCIYENASHVPLWAGLEELEASCGERGLLFAGSALTFVLLCAVIVGLVLYRYRWKLRYLHYIHRGRYMQEQVARQDFRYDVFLSYDNDDYQWVTRQLLPHLEAQGLRACIHQRDFLPGRPIAANIVEAVQTSRRTVCVLSPNFLDSQWCLYEMQMAILEGVHSHRDVLLLLIYEHVGPQALPREVLHYYQTDSYLEYPRDARCLPFFWENLSLALRQ